jgi:hypothetical protein
MSQVPKSFQPERPTLPNCGATWAQQWTVTGELPSGFGDDFTHVLVPVTKAVNANVASDEAAADALRDKIVARIKTIRTKAFPGQFGDDPWLTDKQSAALQWLLMHAEAELDAVSSLYDKWSYREEGPWPLDEAAVEWADCKGKAGQWVTVGARGSQGRNVQWLCPTRAEIKQRAADQKAIVERFKDALRHVRCAEFGYWRIRLVAEAQAALDASGPQGGPGGLTDVPTGTTRPRSRARERVDKAGTIRRARGARTYELPDVEGLPPPEEIFPDEPGPPPEGEGEGGFGEPSPSPSRPSNTKALVLGVAGVALGWLMLKELS